MNLRRIGFLAVMVATAVASSGVASAQSYDEDGIFLFLDAVFATPRGTDNVIATTVDVVGSTQSEDRILTDWGSDLGGEIGFGYQWPSGNRVSISYWQYDNDETTVGDGPAGGFSNFAIGPASFLYGYYGYGYGYFGTFGQPGHYDITTDIEASRVDIEWGHVHELSDTVGMEWSLGLRYASYEETMSGVYGYYASTDPLFGTYTYAARRKVEGDMIGIKTAMRGSYKISDLFSVRCGVGISFLEGDVKGTSGLVPIGTGNAGVYPSTSFHIEDNNRSGTILDYDVAVVWHLVDDRLHVSLGYEHSTWRGIPTDLTRHTTGVFLQQDARDTVNFSGFKTGVLFRF